jgi:hypothetical protein
MIFRDYKEGSYRRNPSLLTGNLRHEEWIHMAWLECREGRTCPPDFSPCSFASDTSAPRCWLQKHERVRLGEQGEPMTVTALDESLVSDDLREAALH